MTRILIILASIGTILILIAWYFSDIFFYIVLSLIFSTLLRPLVNNILQIGVLGNKIPRFFAILISYFIFTLFFGLFVLLFIPLISEQIKVLGSINIDLIFEKILIPIASTEEFLLDNNLSGKSPGFLVNDLRDGMVRFVSEINFTEILNYLLSITGNFFIGLLAVLFITFFLLFDQGLLRRPLFRFIPNRYFEVFISAFYKIERLLSNYLLGLIFQMFSIFSIAALGLSVFGIKYALTIAVFAAVANLVPYLGPIMGAIFGIVIGLSSSGTFGFSQDTVIMSVKILSVFAAVQITDNVFLQPLIFSKSVKAHPLEIFVIIFAGATIAGIPGMIAAIPVYTIIRVSMSEIYSGYNRYQVFRIKK